MLESLRHAFPAMLIVVTICTVGVDRSYAGISMPSTNDALDRLNQAMETIKAPTGAQVTDQAGVKMYIDTYRKIFSSAGFDYERSMIKIINDIQFDRYSVNKATIALNRLARELLRVHVRSGVAPGKYLSKDCAELLIEFRNLIRSNMNKYGGC